MARTQKSGVSVYYTCSDGSTVKQSYSDVNINSNSTEFASAVASVNSALVDNGGGTGWFADVWYKDKSSDGTTNTKITGILCIQEETTVTNDVYGTRPQ